jgi:translation initiation factor 3 subunit C
LQNEAYEREKAAKKKMNATNNRALNTFRQRIRKNNREYEADIKKYREDPSAFDTEDEGEAPVAREVRDEIIGPDGQIRRGFLAAEEDDEGFATVGRGGRATTYTAESIFKHLKAIFDARGKRSTDRGEQIKILEKLRDVAVTPYQKIRVLLALISARFDYSPMAQYMPIEQWTAYVPRYTNLIFSAQSELMTLLQILEDNSSYVIIENTEDISDEDPPPDPKPGEVVKVRGSLVSFIDRLDDELTKSLQNIDPHTTEYIERLRDEQKLYIVIVRGGIWFEKLEKEEYDTGGSASRTVLRRLEHIYYKVYTPLSSC